MNTESRRPYLENEPQEIQDQIYEGRTISAVKMVREQTGLGLKDAKDKVAALEARMRQQFPDAFHVRKAGGCGSAALFCLAVVVYLVHGL